MAIGIGLVKMLLELQHTRKTGALDVAGPGARVRLFIEDGQVVFADEGTVGETLGRILVREHVLTQDQYAAAIESMTELRAAGKRAKLGEVFVQLGLLSVDQVHAALSAQVQQKVMRAIGWGNATFWFVESLGVLEVADRFETAIEPLIVAALRLADRERIDELLAQARDRYPALRADRESGGGSTKLATIARINAFRLSAREDAFARTLDGTRPVRELVGDAELPGVDRGVILAALLLTDALDLHSTPVVSRWARAPRPAPRSSQRMLAATATTTATAATATTPATAATATTPAAAASATTPTPPPVSVRAAPVAMARLASEPPPAGGQPPAATPATGAPASEPPASGPPASKSPASVPTMTPLLAEKAFQNGKKLVRAHRLTEAVAELRRAASLYPATEYDLWAAWAAARADVRGEDAHAEGLRTVAELAIEQDTERAFATYVLGHLARRTGENARAEELFARARSIDPAVSEVEGWDARLRLGAAGPTSTRGEVTALAPLLTTPGAPDVNANAIAKAKADAKATADAKAKGDADAEPEDATVPTTTRGHAPPPPVAPALASSRASASPSAPAPAPASASAPTPPPTPVSSRPRSRPVAPELLPPRPAPTPPPRVETVAADTRHAHASARASAGARSNGKAATARATDPAPRPAPSRRLVGGTIVASAIAAVVLIATRPSAPDATAPTLTSSAPPAADSATPATRSAPPPVLVSPGPSAPASTSAPLPASASPSASASASPSASPSAAASYASRSPNLPPLDTAHGLLDLPRAAEGHRVFVDGRLAGVPPAPIVVACGRRLVKVGSQGREQALVVPCGGTRAVAYP